MSLTGMGVNIGQAENFRPGDPDEGKDEAQAMVNSTVDPELVFYRQTNGIFDPNYNLGNEVNNHAIQVAGVLISTDTTARGIAPDAHLFSIGINAGAPTFDALYAQIAESINHIATLPGQDLSAINLSFGLDNDPGVNADGTSTFTSYIDWSAQVHDILYVRANGQAATPYGIPDDNFNGMTVTMSRKNGAKYREVDDANIFTADDLGLRTFPDIMAPGRDIELTSGNSTVVTDSGTSFAAPHVVGTAALLHQHAIAQGWAANARRHEVLKAVIMNSADKIEEGSITEVEGSPIPIPPRGLLGMERTALKSDGISNWFDSIAYNDDPEEQGSFWPLDEQMGTGHLNASRAFTQYQSGEFDNDGNDVPLIGWDYGTTTLSTMGTDNINRYRLNQELLGGSFVSITLAWDREVTFSPGDGPTYESGDTFVDYKTTDGPFNPPGDSVINDLSLFLVPRDAGNENQAVAASIFNEGTEEHIFFQIPFTGLYDIWVRQEDNEVGNTQNYAVAWWAASATLVSFGDFDNDGTIAGGDLTQWRGDFGIDSGSDADMDGDSDGNDFLIWQRNLGLAAQTPAANTIPEPGAWLLAALAALIGVQQRVVRLL